MGFFTGNENRITTLKELWLSGSSASEIKRYFNDPACTRNVVIGKLHRLKLTDDNRSLPNLHARHEWTKSRRVKDNASGAGEPQVIKPLLQEPKEIGPLNEFPDKRSACRNIKSNPSTEPWRCCGQPVLEGKSFCEYHAQINFVKIIPINLKRKDTRPVTDGTFYRDFIAS